MIDRVQVSGVSRGSRRARLCGLISAMACSLLTGGRAMADFTISIVPTNSVAVAGSTNNVFDVFLTSTTDTTIAGFEVTISAPNGSGIAFTGGDTNTGQPYVFAGNSVGFAFANLTDPVTSKPITDTADISDFATNLAQPIAANVTYGLGEIYFSVASGATPGMYPLTYLSSTGLTGGPPNYYTINPTTIGAQITVTPATVAVPEPSTLLLMGIGGVVAGLASALRRRVA